jgi:hypothetical protein
LKQLSVDENTLVTVELAVVVADDVAVDTVGRDVSVEVTDVVAVVKSHSVYAPV